MLTMSPSQVESNIPDIYMLYILVLCDTYGALLHRIL